MKTKIVTPEFGSLKIMTQKEAKGYGNDTRYLWVFTSYFSKKGEWVIISDIRDFSEEIYTNLKGQRTSSFRVIEFEGNKYISDNFFSFGETIKDKFTILEIKKADNSPLTVEVEVKKGDVIYLHEFGQIAKWTSETNHTMKVSGVFTEEMDSCSSYSVESEAITVPAHAIEDSSYKVNDQPVHIIRTYTDIGGHYFSIDRDGKEIYKVHLHNGFGDGHYRLKFQNGYLFR